MTWAQERRKANSRARSNRQRYAELRVEIDGRLVASDDGINPLPPEFHGKHSTYCNRACRCVLCTEVASDYMAAYQQARRDKRKRNR